MREILKRAAAIAVMSGAGVMSPLAAQPLIPGPLTAGDVVFHFHSAVVGRLVGRAPLAHAEFSGDQLEVVRGVAIVNVRDMQTGNGTRDRHLMETMEADSYPVIRFDLVGVEAGQRTADTTVVTLEGRLTLHGVTRRVSARGTVVRTPRGTDVTATFPLDMRDYGITPPVRALLLRVAPDVVIAARLSFGTARAP